MSGNSSSLRRAARASSPSPSTAVSSSGVVRRQSQRIAPRSTPATTVPTSHAPAAETKLTGPAGVSGSSRPSIAVPAATQAAITDSSSTVRCRIDALVAVIEAEQLGDQHPPREQGKGPHRARGRAGHEQAHHRTGANVGERQHPPQPHVAPEAIGGGLADRQEIRHVRGTRRKSRMRDGRVRPCLCRLTQTLS